MDLTLIKNKLDSINNKGTREKVDFSKVLWKPKAGKHQIRILPSVYNPANPFKEVYFHYGYTKGSILALTNWNEPDPIVEAAKEASKNDPENGWKFAKKLSPKMRVFVPVIVRGEESMGVRLWEFGKEIYTQLLNLATDEDYGDFTSVSEGRDFTVDAVEDTMMGKKIIKSSITPRGRTSVLSNKDEEIELWTTNQPDILKIYRRYTYDELSTIFDKWLNGEEENTVPVEETQPEEKNEENENDNDNAAPWDHKNEEEEEYATAPAPKTPVTETKKPSFKSSTPASYSETTSSTKPKQSKADKFNDLFD